MRHSSAVICLALTLLAGTPLSARQIVTRRGVGPQIKQILITGPVQGGTATTGVIELTAPAQPAAGQFSVRVALTSSHPAVAKVPASVAIRPRATSQSFEVKTNPVSATAQVTITGRVSMLPVTTNLVIQAPVLQSLECSPAELAPAVPLNCKACLDGPAAAGAAVQFGSRPTTALSPVSAAAPLPAGQRCVTWSPVAAATPLALTTTVEAGYGGVSKTAQTKVLARVLSHFSVVPESLIGGVPVTAQVVLTGPAPEGMVVNLAATPPVSVPSQRTIPVGRQHSMFQIPLPPVPSFSRATVTVSSDFFGHHESLEDAIAISPARLRDIVISDTTALVNVPLGGRDVAAVLRLKDGRAGGGMKVQLTSGNPRQATVPAEITIQGTATEAPFTIRVLPCVSFPCSVPIRATGPPLGSTGGTNQTAENLTLTRQ